LITPLEVPIQKCKLFEPGTREETIQSMIDSQQKVTVLIADPGFGKSVVMSVIAF
jgi:C4-type Zn-finger protein